MNPRRDSPTCNSSLFAKCCHDILRAQLEILVPLPCIAENDCELNEAPRSATASIQVELIPARQLASEHLAIWRELQDSNSELSSPCFAPEFTQAAALVCDNVTIAICQHQGRVAAIFPFQLKAHNRGGPVGGIVSDYQGLICRPDFECDPRELLKACNLRAWDFDRLLASQKTFRPYHKLCEPSARIDLSQGYHAYVAQRRGAGTRQIQRCEYALRRLQRDVGPVRFLVHSPDPSLLTQVLQWKSQQYKRSGWKDLFATPWGRGLVEGVHATQNPSFAGVLSLLYAGNILVAGHMGMRSKSVWHYWFPAYDRRFARYSPGLILLLKMAESCEQLGLRSIDIGTGITLYKRRLMNASVSVAEGYVEGPSCRSLLRWGLRALKPLARALAERTH